MEQNTNPVLIRIQNRVLFCFLVKEEEKSQAAAVCLNTETATEREHRLESSSKYRLNCSTLLYNYLFNYLFYLNCFFKDIFFIMSVVFWKYFK